MVPFYDEAGITIYNARCEDVLPSIDPASVSLLLTDPPYGINHTHNGYGRSRPSDWAPTVGDDEPFDPTPLLRYGRCIIWGANHFAHLLPPGGWVVWSKAQDNRWNEGKASTRSLAEVAWTNLHQYVGLYNCFWAGSPLYRKAERGQALHPNQKPAELMRWLVDRWTKPGDLVLDPYMGSGPVARACADLGRRYIGVELVEKYCQVAVSRLRQQTFAFPEA
jgi:site-specific DNA-methyltransferase (adenine-specific)